MNETPYSPVYKRLAVAVILSPAVAMFVQGMIGSKTDESGFAISIAAVMALPALVSVLFLILALSKLNLIKKQRLTQPADAQPLANITPTRASVAAGAATSVSTADVDAQIKAQIEGSTMPSYATETNHNESIWKTYLGFVAVWIGSILTVHVILPTAPTLGLTLWFVPHAVLFGFFGMMLTSIAGLFMFSTPSRKIVAVATIILCAIILIVRLLAGTIV